MAKVAKWLESPEGRRWSRAHHFQNGNQRYMFLMKDDLSYYDPQRARDGWKGLTIRIDWGAVTKDGRYRRPKPTTVKDAGW
jgi:hypothetical protein